MLTDSTYRNKKADRAFTRSAHYLHSWPLNISIRAKFGESTIASQKALNFTIDKWWVASNSFVIEWPAISYFSMSEMEKIAAIENHRSRCAGSLAWFAGVRNAPRIHPWDEQELSFSTKAWIDIPTDTPEEAQIIAHKLFSLGFGKSPIHTASSSGKHVFAYAVNTESLN